MLITACFIDVQPEGQQEPFNQVGYLKPLCWPKANGRLFHTEEGCYTTISVRRCKWKT